MALYLTSRRVRLHPTTASFPLPDGSTTRCGPPDDEEEVVAAYVPEIDEVGVLPWAPEDDEVGDRAGVGALNRPRASRICVAALWPFRLPSPLPPSMHPL
jgi:hypothetical protein